MARRRASRSVRRRGGLRRLNRREYFRSVWSLSSGVSPAPWRLVFTPARRGVSPFKLEFQRNSKDSETGSVQLMFSIGRCRSTGFRSPYVLVVHGSDEVEKAVRVSCAHTAWGGGAGSQGPAPTLLRASTPHTVSGRPLPRVRKPRVSRRFVKTSQLGSRSGSPRSGVSPRRSSMPVKKLRGSIRFHGWSVPRRHRGPWVGNFVEDVARLRFAEAKRPKGLVRRDLFLCPVAPPHQTVRQSGSSPELRLHPLTVA